jgi:hypothetical protein
MHYSNCNGCFFIPPQISKSIALKGSRKQKETAINNLALSSRLRGLRDGLVQVDPERPTGELSRFIYTADNTENLPGILVANEGDDNRPSKDIDSVYDLLGVMYDVMRELTGLNSLDGNGIPLIATCHFGEDYNNAFFDGEQFAMGEGDGGDKKGGLFNSFAHDATVIFHEGGHGYLRYIAPFLTYYGENGAVNEHCADVLAAIIEQTYLKQKVTETDWLIGRNIFSKNVKGKAVRSFKSPGTAYDDPVVGKDLQPAHMDDLYTGKRDNGGVHLNSGILNKFFYETAMKIGGNIAGKTARMWFGGMQELNDEVELIDFYNIIKAQSISIFGKNTKEHKAVLAAGAVVGFNDTIIKVKIPESAPEKDVSTEEKKNKSTSNKKSTQDTTNKVPDKKTSSSTSTKIKVENDPKPKTEYKTKETCKADSKPSKAKVNQPKASSSKVSTSTSSSKTKPSKSKSKSDFRTELRPSNLAKRLNLKTSIVVKHKNDPEWLAQRDPNNVKWHFDNEAKVFFSDRPIAL